MPLLLASANAASISDTVWVDLNSNGVFNAGEPLLGEAEVKLYFDKNDDGFPERLLERQAVAADGSFSFTNLVPGDYSVGISLESLAEQYYLPTTKDAGAEDIDNDLDPNILRTDVISVQDANQDILNKASIGMLPGSTNVTYHGRIDYQGFAWQSIGINPHDAWTYQDILFVALPDKGLTTEKVTRWLKWYKRVDQLYQQMLLLPNYQTRCRSGNEGGIRDKRVVAMVQDSCGAGCGNGRKAEAVGIIDGASAEPELWNYHWILFYEMSRGLQSPWDGKSVWPPRSVILPHFMGALSFYEFGGLEGLQRSSFRGFTPGTFLPHSETWQTLGLNYADTFADDVEDRGVTIDGITYYGGSVISFVLYKIAFEEGYEKLFEVLKNMGNKETATTSLEAAMNFTESVLDATDGAYADILSQNFGFPTPAELQAFRLADSGILRPSLGVNFQRFAVDIGRELPFDGVPEWTHTVGPDFRNRYIKGSDGSVFLSTDAPGLWQAGNATNTARDLIYHSYLNEDGISIPEVTISGLSDWMTKTGQTSYQIRVYRNMDWYSGFKDAEIMGDGALLDVIPFPNESIFTSDGGGIRAFGDSAPLTADEITIRSPEGSAGRGTISGIAIYGSNLPGPFKLSSPANRAETVSTATRFDWEAHPGATEYLVTLSSAGAPDLTAVVATNQWTPASPLGTDTDYTWKVAGRSASATWESDAWTFRTESELVAPQLLSPSDGATGLSQTPRFDWTDVPGADSYLIQVRSVSLLEPQEFVHVASSSELNFPYTLSGETTYVWDITAQNEAGSVTSERWGFTTGPDPCSTGDFNHHASELSYRWDFGPPGAALEPGWRRFSPCTTQGFMKWVSLPPSSGGAVHNGGALQNDLLGQSLIFGFGAAEISHELASGHWEVTVHFSDGYPQSGMKVIAEGEEVLRDISIAANTRVQQTFRMDITDGELNLVFDDADPNKVITISGLQLTRLGDALDRDRDGLLDTWETLHFGTIFTQDGQDDTDGDGTSEWQEFILEMDPNDPDEHFHLSIIVAENGSCSLEMPSRDGVVFRIFKSPDMQQPRADWAWEDIKDNDGNLLDPFTINVGELSSEPHYFYSATPLRRE